MANRKRKVLNGTPREIYVNPKNARQAEFLGAMESSQMIIAKGSAGTGKTYCAAATAAKLYMRGDISQIVLVRPNIPTGPTLGSFTGNADEKLSHWVGPMIDCLTELLGANNVNYQLSQGTIKLQPLETIRGKSFEEAFVIVDEAQQLTVAEIKAISTRIGRGSKMVFIGDPAQRDIKVSGLVWLADLCRRYHIDCPVITFTPDDIVRSGIVGQLVRAFEKDMKGS